MRKAKIEDHRTEVWVRRGRQPPLHLSGLRFAFDGWTGIDFRHHRFLHELMNAYVLTLDPRPSRGSQTYIDVEKPSVVSTNTALEKGRHLDGEFVLLLQGQAGDIDVRGHAARVFTVVDAAYFPVMALAAVGVVDDDGFADQITQLLERVHQALFDLESATAVASEFSFREMWTQVSHDELRKRGRSALDP